ncbi:MAG: pentapeptide repeat-containing protein, partial [Microcoleaceae cyanobacterium]
GSDKVLANALAAFYVKSAAADNCVEFFHKSFGEFLCADCMAETMISWTETVKKRGRSSFAVSEKEVNWQIYDLFGYGNLTVEIVDYLMGLLIQREVDFVTLFERLHEFYLSWCHGDFIEAWDLSDELFPLKKARQLQQHGIERGQRQVDIYTGLNVLILLFELHRYGQSNEELKEALHFYPCGDPNSDEFDVAKLSNIMSYAQTIGINTFRYAVGHFMKGGDFRKVSFLAAVLVGVDFSEANLEDTSFIDSVCIRVKFINANLKGSRLIDCNLKGAQLEGANLCNSDIKFANLTKIKWDLNTKWLNIIDLHETMGFSDDLKEYPGFKESLLLNEGCKQAKDNRIEEAIEIYKKVQLLDPELEISAHFWTHLCWYGCLADKADKVLFAGEKALELNPKDGRCRESIGLAKALTGDLAGAIVDFQASLEDAERFSDPSWKPEKQKRLNWLEALKRGENPFTPEELEALRREEG